MTKSVELRKDGYQLERGTVLDILRFEVADLNTVIKNCVEFSELYGAIARSKYGSSNVQVVPISCFAVTDVWTPERLAEGYRYTSYREAAASKLIEAGFEIWPTSVYTDGVPDHRNEVHFDVIAAYGEDLGLADFNSSSSSTRRLARERLKPAFVRLLEVLGEPKML